MREMWKALRARRPRLGRGGRTARNLLLALALAALVWGQYGCPLPTAELEFRRLERARLMPRSELAFLAPKPKNLLETADGTELELLDPVAVGLGTDWAAVGYRLRTEGRWDTLKVFPLEDGPSLVPVWRSLLNVTGGGGDDLIFAAPVLVVRVPEEAAGGRLALDTVYQEREFHRESPLWKLGEGLWLAAVDNPKDIGYSDNWFAGADCSLTLYRADGSLLLERSMTAPSPRGVRR